ncbi:MAG: hypothetical protein RL108_402 [Bacteroidota bacterium]|jgi:hypothetical protein
MVHQEIVLDPHQNQLLQKEGYVVLPLLSENEVAELHSYFKEKTNLEEGSFYATAHANEVDFRKEMSDKIVEVIQEKVNATLQNHELLGASYIVKSKKLLQPLQPHQDWNIVDESEYRSYNIWIPLVDLNEENGAILIMPQSHSWIKNYRHSSIACSFQEVHSQIWDAMKPLYLKAGEALLYDHALLHASMPNTSQLDRVACACGIIPKGAPLRYYWNNNGTVEEYESSKEFFLKENVFTGPKGLKKLKNIDFDFISINEDQFYELSNTKKPVVVIIEDVEKNDQNSAQTKPSFFQVYTFSNILNECRYRFNKLLR